MTDIATPQAHGASQGELKSVILPVTPELSVPASRLPTIPLQQAMNKIASRESQTGLVDAGGMFSFEEDACVLQTCHPHGFIGAATAAFAEHYPFAVKPQHFWLMILQAISIHVEKHAEELRAKWVAHEGKKELEVRCDEFVLGSRNNWASVVDGKPDCFSLQIDHNVVEGVAAELSPGFSNTTPVENIALKMTVMDITKSFFSFKCSTMCGFPSIIMEGSSEDWILLRRNAELLIQHRCQQDFASGWCACLLPILDIFVQEYQKSLSGQGQPDEQFWNSMCKLGGTRGSGARTWFNGWINIFFPYILEHPNPYMVAYSADNWYVKEGRDQGRYSMCAPRDVQGPDCVDFPKGLAGAPVVWDYFGKVIKLQFKAGFVGAEQDQNTGVVRPVVGWAISHDDAPQEKHKLLGF
jgi:hypothetical protein